jgi:bifunctional ADP-heptose synthase (sugar kinase/adenylyltransferase)
MPDTPAALARKLVPAAQLSGRSWPRPLVFTNGVFDVLHRGHGVYLAAARQLGKGPDRPLNGEVDRLTVVAALESVSFVTLFDEPTPCGLLERCRPDIYVKGGDYDMETLEETRLVRSWGGRSVAIPFVDGYSTSSLLRRIRGGA